jgi:hypothetical protein
MVEAEVEALVVMVEAVAAMVLAIDLAHDRIEEVAALSLSVYHSILFTSIETGLSSLTYSSDDFDKIKTFERLN